MALNEISSAIYFEASGPGFTTKIKEGGNSFEAPSLIKKNSILSLERKIGARKKIGVNRVVKMSSTGTTKNESFHSNLRTFLNLLKRVRSKYCIFKKQALNSKVIAFKKNILDFNLNK